MEDTEEIKPWKGNSKNRKQNHGNSAKAIKPLTMENHGKKKKKTRFWPSIFVFFNPLIGGSWKYTRYYSDHRCWKIITNHKISLSAPWSALVCLQKHVLCPSSTFCKKRLENRRSRGRRHADSFQKNVQKNLKAPKNMRRSGRLGAGSTALSLRVTRQPGAPVQFQRHVSQTHMSSEASQPAERASTSPGWAFNKTGSTEASSSSLSTPRGVEQK